MNNTQLKKNYDFFQIDNKSIYRIAYFDVFIK